MDRLTPLFLLLSACGGGVAFVPLSGTRYPTLPSDAPVNIMVTKLPDCQYIEIGMMTVKAFSVSEKTFELLRKKAREIGAPIVLITGRRSEPQGGVAAVMPMGNGPALGTMSTATRDIVDAVAVICEVPNP